MAICSTLKALETWGTISDHDSHTGHVTYNVASCTTLTTGLPAHSVRSTHHALGASFILKGQRVMFCFSPVVPQHNSEGPQSLRVCQRSALATPQEVPVSMAKGIPAAMTISDLCTPSSHALESAMYLDHMRIHLIVDLT